MLASTRVRLHRSLIRCAAGSVIAIPMISLAQVDASWLAGADGTWSAPANWSSNPQFPSNGNGGNNYNAFISAAGSYTVSLNSAVNVSNFTLNSASATLQHSAGTFSSLGAIQLLSGNYRLSGGTISGGTINQSGGTLSFGVGATNAGNLTNGATVLGGLRLDGGTHARFFSNATYLGNATITSNSRVFYHYTNTLANTTVNLDGGLLGVVGNTTTLTLASNVLLRGSGSVNADVNTTSHIINQGTIRADAASQVTVGGRRLTNGGTIEASTASVVINPSNWTNSGTLIVGGSATLFTSGSWSHSGAIRVNGGTLSLGGNFPAAGLTSNFARVGGFVEITPGLVNNSGHTLAMNAITGDWRLNGGTISGGTITESAGARFIFDGGNGSNSNRLANGATFVGDLLFDQPGAVLNLQSNGTFTGNTATLLGNSAYFGIEYNTTLPSGRSINLNGLGNQFGADGASMTIASGALIRGRGRIEGRFRGDGTVTNNGDIRSDITAGSIQIAQFRLNNNGTLTAMSGCTMNVGAFSTINTGTLVGVDASSTVTTGAATFTNSGGTIITNGGTLAFFGGVTALGLTNNFVRSGGTVIFGAQLFNANHNFVFNSITGPWLFSGGTINGGSVTFLAGGTMQFGAGRVGNFSNNALLTGGLLLDADNADARFFSGGTFSGDALLNAGSNTLAWNYTGTLDNKTIHLDGMFSELTIEGTNTLTLGANALVRGRGAVGPFRFSSGTSTLINNGTIRADIASGSLNVGPRNLTNNGTLAAIASGAVLSVATLSGNAGTLLASNGGVVRINAGTYTANLSPVTSTRGIVNLQGTPTKATDWDLGGVIIFNYTGSSPFAALQAQATTGYAAGAWNGPGIRSTTAQLPGNAGRTGVGIIEASELFSGATGSYLGESIDNTNIIIRFALLGDTNLSGTVDISDFARLAANFNLPSTWARGDFNYDNVTTIGDFAALASNFNQSLATDLPRTIVPEPTALTVLAAVAALHRQRRKPAREIGA